MSLPDKENNKYKDSLWDLNIPQMWQCGNLNENKNGQFSSLGRKILEFLVDCGTKTKERHESRNTEISLQRKENPPNSSQEENTHPIKIQYTLIKFLPGK